MTNFIIYSVPVLLLLSTLLFWTLIPGGPVETRKFFHYSPYILGSFNTFLTILGFTSLVVVYFCFAGNSWVYIVAALCGVSYFLVYALDLGKIFPVSPDKMSRALFAIEIAGLVLSIPLTLLAVLSLTILKNTSFEYQISTGGIILFLLMVIVGVGIIIFATRVTMKK